MADGMPPAPGGGTLPYGTSMSDPRAPWNAPEVGEYDYDALIEYCLDELLGDLIIEGNQGEFEVELASGEWRLLRGWTLDSVLSYFIAEREDDIEEWLDTRERERMIDGYYEPDDDRI